VAGRIGHCADCFRRMRHVPSRPGRPRVWPSLPDRMHREHDSLAADRLIASGRWRRQSSGIIFGRQFGAGGKSESAGQGAGGEQGRAEKLER